MAYTKYSLTPANNTAAPPDGAPEGMLPSAVNDTMRDMMAQIRDVGDGVRDGTYTMTAVKITGGTINGATIGATTATTGKFTAVTNSALTSGRVTYAGTAGVLQDSAALTFDGSNIVVNSTTPAYFTGTSNLAQISINRSPSTGTIFNASQSAAFINIDGVSGGSSIQFATATANNTQPTERMRIDSSGALLLNTTSSIDSGILQVAYASGVNNGIIFRTNGTGSQYAAIFYNGNGAVGSITTNGSATAYNTSSDYRLKENIIPMTGALAKVAQLKPVTYKWKVDGSNSQGFIAHELAEVVPQCVTGEKDGLDKDGKPKYQGVDTSFLVATLTAAIQELKAEFDAYKATHP